MKDPYNFDVQLSQKTMKSIDFVGVDAILMILAKSSCLYLFLGQCINAV